VSAPKYAKKRDGNQKEIMEALRYSVLRVWEIGSPLDLLCLGRSKAQLFMVEVKDPASAGYRKKGRSDQKAQTELIELAELNGWPIHRVTNMEAAIAVARNY
jgi:hypothetical protein